MAIQTTDAIVLRKHDIRETSIVLTLFTRDFGKICGLLKGARGPSAAAGSNPQAFSLNKVVFYEKKRSGLNSISQCDLKDFFGPIRSDLEKTVYADYLLELVDTVMIEGDTDIKIYELLLNSLRLLTGSASPKRAARIFEIKLMDISGFMPEFKECAGCGKDAADSAKFSLRLGGLLCQNCASKDGAAVKVSKGTLNFIERVRKSAFQFVSRLKVSRDVGKELEAFMRRFVDYHIQRELKTVGFLRKIKL